MSDSQKKFKFDVNIIYNKANSPLSKTTDTELSLKFTKCFDKHLEIWRRKSYYHGRDALPGQNIFSQLESTVESSRFTAVILTEGFVKDCWSKYANQYAFKTLLDEDQLHRLIPIAIGLHINDIPSNLKTKHVLFFPQDWNDESEEWNNIKLLFEESQEDGAANERRMHAEEVGDNLLRSDAGVLVTQDTESHKQILDQCLPKLVEDLDAILVVNELIKTQSFRYSTLRDIRETDPPSKRNQKLIQLVRGSGWTGYKIFKRCLSQSRQENLVEVLEEKEQAVGIPVDSANQAIEPVTPSGDYTDSPSIIYSRTDTSRAESNQGTDCEFPSFVGLYQSGVGDRNGLESVISDVSVAGETIRQLSPDVQSAHTINMERQISSHQAMLSLEIDTPPSMSAPQMKIEPGPKLRLPPTKQLTTTANTRPAQMEKIGKPDRMSASQTSLKTIYKKDEHHVLVRSNNLQSSGFSAMEDIIAPQRNAETASSNAHRQTDTKTSSQMSLSQDTDLVFDDMTVSNTDSGLSLGSLRSSDPSFPLTPEESPQSNSSLQSDELGMHDRSHMHRAEPDGGEAEMYQTGGKADTELKQVANSGIRREVDVAQLGETEPSSNTSQQTHTAGNHEVSGSQLRETEPGSSTSQQIHRAGNHEVSDSQLRETEPSSNTSQQTHTAGTGGQSITPWLVGCLCSIFTRPELAFNPMNSSNIW